MAEPSILALTGASGAGKTTLVAALRDMRLPGVGCYHFDSIGVPSPEEMTRLYGGGEQWQAAATGEWIERLMRNDDGVRVAVLDGQTRPSVLRDHLERLGARSWRIVLADCDPAERNARLYGPRAQPELATGRMDSWAAYLRGQADALGLHVIDTARPLRRRGRGARRAGGGAGAICGRRRGGRVKRKRRDVGPCRGEAGTRRGREASELAATTAHRRPSSTPGPWMSVPGAGSRGRHDSPLLPQHAKKPAPAVPSCAAEASHPSISNDFQPYPLDEWNHTLL